MQTVTITVGRNIGTEPMPSDAWRQYRDDVRRALVTADATVYAAATYRGMWEGTYEDAAIWHAAIDDAAVDPLRDALSGLVAVYGQDAAGYAVGTSELVQPDPQWQTEQAA